ncbi:hypothetical protein SUGI_0717540 [Cryptomeria japonica]|nr:hypothetical protein SUGI_0717540 [Cryptomeria japonica]
MKSMAECDYPRPCGDYGVCKDGQCSCPSDDNAFKPIDITEPNFGCFPRVHVVCSEKSRDKDHQFLELQHVSYFTYVYENSSTPGLLSRDACKKLCLEDCSCNAAFFRYGANFLVVMIHCYLESNISSMKTNNPVDQFYNSTAYIKIQSRSKRNKSLVVIITCASGGGALALFIFLSIKLGSGGFGSVYEGVLSDGSKIAVKRLDKAGHGQKGFRVEVETLGKIDHINLVRLKGFYAQKSHRMLVYEHLHNGSLDKWIFSNKKHRRLLDWKSIAKVVLNIARGLTYLHEECQELIIHSDINPQNILLDQNFNAKLSDFGLAKLINREQSEVITMMRGTPGHLSC